MEQALLLIEAEAKRASEKHPSFHSPHEGYAVIKEELDELWEAIREAKNFKERNIAMLEEAVQCGAMCLRFLMDLIEVNPA